MSEIGAFEAKTHLPRLLKRVQAGERFVITRHNRPVAELIPFRTHGAGKIAGRDRRLGGVSGDPRPERALGAANDRRGAPVL